MKIAVLGSGMVGQAHANKLIGLGHDVAVGTRSPAGKEIDGLKPVSYKQAAAHGEIIIEAINGGAAVGALKEIKAQLKGKILIDISNALDFSSGQVKITTANGPSLGEQIQAALPDTKVVKAFSTMNAAVQVAPKLLAGGDHNLFIAGDDTSAKEQVSKLVKQWYGWENILDLGGIKSARGMEMLMPFWLTVRGRLDTSNFNYKIVI